MEIARWNDFNSRPSARGDGIAGRGGGGQDISIHAPPRGATVSSVPHDFFPVYFNSRPSARGDEQEESASFNIDNISIHAPPRGATLLLAVKYETDKFQFTPLREGRPHRNRASAAGKEFQFTPLREGRRQKICNFCKSFVQPLQISMA